VGKGGKKGGERKLLPFHEGKKKAYIVLKESSIVLKESLHCFTLLGKSWVKT